VSRATMAGLAMALGLGLGAMPPLSSAATGDDLVASYLALGAGPFDAAVGRRAWEQKHPPAKPGGPESCAACHGTDLTRTGRHAVTGKPIEPMAVSVNPKRMTDPAEVEKWFGRNCRQVLGRECSPQEKGDFVRFIQSQ
jgi:hypothetical protein